MINSPSKEAAETVKARGEDYGCAYDNFGDIADLITVVLRSVLRPGHRITRAHVAQILRMVKEARLMHKPDHKDSLVDICGYADLQQEVTRWDAAFRKHGIWCPASKNNLLLFVQLVGNPLAEKISIRVNSRERVVQVSSSERLSPSEEESVMTAICTIYAGYCVEGDGING